MKKIVFVVDQLSNGGAERVVSIIANKLAEKKYKVFIIMLHGNERDYVISDDIIIIQRDVGLKNHSKHLQIIKFLRHQFLEINPNVIVSFDVFNNIYSIVSKIFLANKLLISERNDPNQYPSTKLVRIIRNFLYNLTDGVIFQTIDAKNYFNKNIQKKGTIILNPVNEKLPRWKMDRTNKFIISVNRISDQKNIPMLIDAFARIAGDFPEVQLKIFGKGPLENKIKGYIAEKGLSKRIFLMGYSENIYSEMAKAQLFVISSNFEGISNSMLEALAIGVPVISTNSPIGGAKMMIKNGVNGFLVPVNDDLELSNKMETILNDSQLASSFSENSKKIRIRLQPDRITDQWINVIENL